MFFTPAKVKQLFLRTHTRSDVLGVPSPRSPRASGAWRGGRAGSSPTVAPTAAGGYRGACTPCPSCHCSDLASANTKETI